MAKAAARSTKEAEQQSRAERVKNGKIGGKERVPRELRQKMKRAKGAKGLLQDLEQQVRDFVKVWEEKEKELERRKNRKPSVGKQETGDEEEKDSEDEEIVFVGRNGRMRDLPKSPTTPTLSEDEDDDEARELDRDKLVFDSLVDDHGASFWYDSGFSHSSRPPAGNPTECLGADLCGSRWLVHTIATYYNLRTYSVTTGDPARREAYVGIRDDLIRQNCRHEVVGGSLPQPLWGLV